MFESKNWNNNSSIPVLPWPLVNMLKALGLWADNCNYSSLILQLQYFPYTQTQALYIDAQRHWYVCMDKKTGITVLIFFNCSFPPTHKPKPHT